MSTVDPYEVRRYGTDSSGRPIYMNVGMKAAFDVVCERSGVTPTIVQGAYMARAGGGASTSAGTHNGGACLDLRTWDLTSRQWRRWLREARRCGWRATWFRDERHGGFDPHIHANYVGDRDATADAAWQWSEVRAGRDGLASRGRDYCWRPKSFAAIPYKHWLKAKRSWFDMATKKEMREVVDAALKAERSNIVGEVKHAVLDDADLFPDGDRNTSVRSALGQLVTLVPRLGKTLKAIAADCKDAATKQQLEDLGDELLDEIRED